MQDVFDDLSLTMDQSLFARNDESLAICIHVIFSKDTFLSTFFFIRYSITQSCHRLRRFYLWVHQQISLALVLDRCQTLLLRLQRELPKGREGAEDLGMSTAAILKQTRFKYQKCMKYSTILLSISLFFNISYKYSNINFAISFLSVHYFFRIKCYLIFAKIFKLYEL